MSNQSSPTINPEPHRAYLHRLEDLMVPPQSLRRAAEQRIDAAIEKSYGISGFTSLVSRYLPDPDQRPIALLARQMPIPCIETISFVLTSRALGLEPVIAPFRRDSFNANSLDKVAALRERSFRWNKPNQQRFQTAYHLDKELPRHNGKPLGSLVAKNGRPLADLHEERIRSIFPDLCIVDTSGLMSELLIAAKRRPETVFVTNDLGKEEAVATSRVDLSARAPDQVRPPASWYYPLYLAIFTTGRILLETYENPRGEVAHAKQLFDKTLRQLKLELGLSPSVLEIPPLSPGMLDTNDHLFEASPTELANLQGSSGRIAERYVREAIGSGVFRSAELAQEIALLAMNFGRPSAATT